MSRPVLIFRQLRTAPGAAQTLTHTIPAQDAQLYRRLTVRVLAENEPVTVNFRSIVDGQDFPVRGKTGGTAAADEWWIDTSEDLEAGDLNVQVVTGTPGPSTLEVEIIGLP